MIPKNSRNCRKGLLGLHEHWRCVGPRATVEKTGQPVDPARLCFLFLSSPVLPAKTSKTQQAVDFINFFYFFCFPDLPLSSPSNLLHCRSALLRFFRLLQTLQLADLMVVDLAVAVDVAVDGSASA